MNEIGNNFLLAGDTFMPEMDLRQPWFTYSACGPFVKTKEKMWKHLKKQEFQNELDKASFKNDMVYGDFTDLKRRTACDKILSDKAFNIAKIPK